jgi:hypothetical protein
MSRAIITESKLTAIADAIRAKTGGSADLTVDEMASEISTIGGLPSAYKQVEYIQTDDAGFCRLEIDYYIKATDNCYGTFYLDSSKVSPWCILFGATDTSQQYPDNCIKACRIALGSSTSQFQFIRGGRDATGNSVLNKIIGIYILNGIYNARIFASTNSQTNVGNDYSNIQDCVEKCVFFANNASAGGIRLYSFVVTNAYGIPQVCLIPCYRKSDNEIGVYDIINEKFYTNIGTGTFTKGADV